MAPQSPNIFGTKDVTSVYRYSHALVKVVLIPLLVLLFMFVGVFSWMQVTIVQEQRRITQESAVEYLRQASEGFSFDLMLRDQEAVLLRLEYLRAQARSRFPLIDVCIEVEDERLVKVASTCAFFPKTMNVEKVSLKIERELVGVAIFGVTANFSQLALVKLMLWPVLVALTLTFLTGSIMLWLIGKYILRPMVIKGENKVRENAISKTVQMIAHDLRRPFSIFQVVLDELKSAKNGEEAKKIADERCEIISAARKISDRMLEDILSSGKAVDELTKTPVNFKLFVSRIVEELSFIRGVPSTAIQMSGSEDVFVEVDENKIDRVIMNILGNAIDAVGAKGRIWVRWRVVHTGEFVVEIGNFGSFIPIEVRKKIFDSYYSQGKSTGTGLGLYIAKRFVQAHGGKIWCTSGAIGKTVFKFTLPDFCIQKQYSTLNQQKMSQHVFRACSERLESRRDELKTRSLLQVNEHFSTTSNAESGHSEQALKIDIIQQSHSRKNLLVVDDDQVYQDGIERALKRAGLKGSWYCFMASTPEEAKNLKRQIRFDACICDYDLGCNQYDGIALLNALEEPGMNMKKILHTNRFVSNSQKELMKDVWVVSKPITVSELVFHLNSKELYSTESVPSTVPSKNVNVK